MELPKEFLARMEGLLGQEYPAFLESFTAPPYRGVRWNPLKCGLDELRRTLPFELSPTPFSPLCFYAAGEERVGALPAHHAGMFYSQEPSASCAVTLLDPRPGERILDLCAAPGGKSGQIAALLEGEGLLWSNEIVKSRAAILLSNLERLGVRNAVVSSCHPQKLCETLTGYFDRVLVDAPCSGEGMFRRDPAAVSEWTPESPAACAQRQAAILDSAALAVKAGGLLVYSTCTFSVEENEAAALAFSERHPDFIPEAVSAAFGRPALYGAPGRRVFPMDGGEGHFVAVFRRVSGPATRVRPFAAEPGKFEKAAVPALWNELFTCPAPERFARVGDRILLLPDALPELNGLGVLRAGVELGTVKGQRIEPSHNIFMAAQAAHCRNALDFSPEDPALAAFLQGEELPCPEGLSGYAAVCVSGVTVGFGKASGGRLKNHYPKGLRQRAAAPNSR